MNLVTFSVLEAGKEKWKKTTTVFITYRLRDHMESNSPFSLQKLSQNKQEFWSTETRILLSLLSRYCDIQASRKESCIAKNHLFTSRNYVDIEYCEQEYQCPPLTRWHLNFGWYLASFLADFITLRSQYLLSLYTTVRFCSLRFSLYVVFYLSFVKYSDWPLVFKRKQKLNCYLQLFIKYLHI